MKRLVSLLICGVSCTPGVTESNTPDTAASVAEPVIEHFEPMVDLKVDLLLVIDDSGSMCQEQRALVEQFPQIVEALDARGADFRIAVTSTDMHKREGRGAFLTTPAAPVPSLNCKDADGEPLVPDTAGCDALQLSPILSGASTRAELQESVRCMANLGTSGDGFEKGLAAMRTALSCTGPNAGHFDACCSEGSFDPECSEALEFLRPDAVLAVLFLSDEDDCSDPVTEPSRSALRICRGLSDPEASMEPYEDCEDPQACYEAECGALEPRDCALERCIISRSTNSHCEWRREMLTPVEDYADFLRGLKARPEQVLVSAIVGQRAYGAEGVRRFDDGPMEPSCESALGKAFAGHRYLALAEAFRGVGCNSGREGQATCASLCAGDLDGPVGLVGRRIRELGRRFCLSRPPMCRIGTGEEARPCDGVETLSLANYPIDVGLDCEGCPPPEHRVVLEPSCPGEVLIELLETPDAGRVRVEYTAGEARFT